MYLKQLFVAVPAGLFILGGGVADAGETIHESSAPLAWREWKHLPKAEGDAR